ncbi:MAG: S1 RNA-binding domain-containing protein [Clostridia bacterium]|nr:S1 RNA-binding domain-containing protein [Clostridia bacterium]
MPVSVGEIVEGKITDIMQYGVFVKLEDGKSGLVHISEVSNEYVEDINQVVKKGDTVKVKILSMDDSGKIALSIKKALPREDKRNRNNNVREKKVEEGPQTLDDMLSKFLKDSDERQLDLKRSMESKRGYSKRR